MALLFALDIHPMVEAFIAGRLYVTRWVARDLLIVNFILHLIFRSVGRNNRSAMSSNRSATRNLRKLKAPAAQPTILTLTKVTG